MSINQPNDQQQQPLSPRIVFNSTSTRYVELSIAYSEDASWHDAIQRLEAAYHGDNITLCQMGSEESPTKLTLSAQSMELLIIGYLDYLANQGIIIGGSLAEHPLVQAFTRYVHFCEVEQMFRPPVERTHEGQDDFFGDDDLSGLDAHPF